MAFNKMDMVGGQRIEDTSTTQQHPLGLRVKAYDSTYGYGEFAYMKGVASTVVGSLAELAFDDGTTVLAAARSKGPLGVAMSINVASQYGWYQIWGKGVIKAGTVADNAQVYLTASGGVVDDAVVAGDIVYGAKFASADGTPSAGLAEVELQYPNCADTDNA